MGMFGESIKKYQSVINENISLKEEVAALKAELAQQTTNKQSTPCSNCGDGKFLLSGEKCPRCGRVYKQWHSTTL
jgi:uncharacterized C2H2 Zn-finger protein